MTRRGGGRQRWTALLLFVVDPRTLALSRLGCMFAAVDVGSPQR